MKSHQLNVSAVLSTVVALLGLCSRLPVVRWYVAPSFTCGNTGARASSARALPICVLACASCSAGWLVSAVRTASSSVERTRAQQRQEDQAQCAHHSYRSASIGSSRDALHAGYRPKQMPTSALNPTASAITSRRTSIGQPKRSASRCAADQPERDADEAAHHRERERLDQELDQDVARLGADRHAHADLARPLGDADEHDVHDADAADEQRDGGDAGEQRRQRLRALLLAARDLGQVADREVVVGAGRDVVAVAQELGDARGARGGLFVGDDLDDDRAGDVALQAALDLGRNVDTGMKTASS